MPLSPYVGAAMMALAPAVYWPMQDLFGPVQDKGLVPHSPAIGAGTTLGIDTLTPLGNSFAFDGSATTSLTTAWNGGNVQPMAMGIFFSITDLAKQDHTLFYIGSNQTGDGWGLVFNHNGNGHVWLLRGAIAYTDLGVVIADHLWHSAYAGYTPTNALGVTIDGVYGFTGVLGFNAPQLHLSVGDNLWTGGNNHLHGGLCHFAYFFGNIPSTAQWNTVIQGSQGLASPSVGASQADVATIEADIVALNLQLAAILAAVRKTF